MFYGIILLYIQEFSFSNLYFQILLKFALWTVFLVICLHFNSVYYLVLIVASYNVQSLYLHFKLL